MIDTIETISQNVITTVKNYAAAMASGWFSDDNIKQKVHKGEFVKLSKDDIAPATYAVLQAKVKASGLHEMPLIYLDKRENSEATKINVVTTFEGHHVITIKMGVNAIVTPAFVRDILAPSNAEIAAEVKHHELIPITANGLSMEDATKLIVSRDLATGGTAMANKLNEDLANPDIRTQLKNAGVSAKTYAEYAQMAKRMGLPYTPDLYLSPGMDSNNFSAITKEGRMYIVIGDLDFAQAQTQLGVLGHELDHHHNKDVTPENIARVHNLGPVKAKKMLRAEEARTDIEGSGPLGSCQPLLLAGSLDAMLEPSLYAAFESGEILFEPGEILKREKIFQQRFPEKSYNDFVASLPESLKDIVMKNKEYEGTHPPTAERMWALLEENANPQGRCIGQETAQNQLVTPTNIPSTQVAASKIKVH